LNFRADFLSGLKNIPDNFLEFIKIYKVCKNFIKFIKVCKVRKIFFESKSFRNFPEKGFVGILPSLELYPR
jgi:glutaredoxin-related protein